MAWRTQQRVVLLREEPLVLTHVGGLVLRCPRRDDDSRPEQRVVWGEARSRSVRSVRAGRIQVGRARRENLRHVANVPTHVFDALHAVPQVAHETVAVPYEREDRDHRRHRVCLIVRVKAGQPAAWRGRGREWAGVSPHEPHSCDGASAHCCKSSLSSHSAAIFSLTLRTPSACQRTNMAEPVWRSGRAPSCGEASAPRTVAR